MSKDVKNIANGETIVNADSLVNLQIVNNANNQTIGAQKETIKNLRDQIVDLKKDHTAELAKVRNEAAENEERLGKEVRIIKGNSRKVKVCPHCGQHNDEHANYCSNYDCESYIRGVKATTIHDKVEYKNLDDAIETIRKDLEKDLPKSIHELEQENAQLVLDKDKLYKENGRFEQKNAMLAADYQDQIEKFRKETRKKYEDKLEDKSQKIKELEEEMEKIRTNKTDEIIEENRKQEIVDLKLHIEDQDFRIAELENIVESNRSTSKKFNLLEKRDAAKTAAAEREAKEDRTKRISSDYPTDMKFWDYMRFGDLKLRNPFSKKEEGGWNLRFVNRIHNFFTF